MNYTLCQIQENDRSVFASLVSKPKMSNTASKVPCALIFRAIKFFFNGCKSLEDINVYLYALKVQTTWPKIAKQPYGSADGRF